MKIARTLCIVAFLPVITSLGGCFTGVESTPRINVPDEERHRTTGISTEERYLADIAPQAPSAWQAGKRFRVTDGRIRLIFLPHSSSTDSLPGHDIFFENMTTARTLTGDDATELTFGSADGRKFHYRITSLDSAKIDTIAALEIPFTIDLDLVDEINRRMRGRHFYITTPSWYVRDGNDFKAVAGLRHIEVKVDSVEAGNVHFPAAVYFTIADPTLAARVKTKSNAVLMSIGTRRAATRNFETLFAFENPRKSHPLIRDEVWEFIISSKVRSGMSREECRLALGAPAEILRLPSYAGMRERWSYSDGVMLLFDDGFLSSFRL